MATEPQPGNPWAYEAAADLVVALPQLCRAAREERGLSIRAAAEQAGIPPASWVRLEVPGSGNGTHTIVAALRWLAAQHDPWRPCPAGTTDGRTCQYECGHRGRHRFAWGVPDGRR